MKYNKEDKSSYPATPFEVLEVFGTDTMGYERYRVKLFTGQIGDMVVVKDKEYFSIDFLVFEVH